MNGERNLVDDQTVRKYHPAAFFLFFYRNGVGSTGVSDQASAGADHREAGSAAAEAGQAQGRPAPLRGEPGEWGLDRVAFLGDFWVVVAAAGVAGSGVALRFAAHGGGGGGDVAAIDHSGAALGVDVAVGWISAKG